MCMLLLESYVRIGISVSGFPVCSLGTCRLEMPVCSCSNRPFPPPHPKIQCEKFHRGDPVREALHPFTDISPPRYRYIFLNSGDPVRVREYACAKRTSGYSTPRWPYQKKSTYYVHMYVNVINTATASLAAVEYYLLLVQARHPITCPRVKLSLSTTRSPKRVACIVCQTNE